MQNSPCVVCASSAGLTWPSAGGGVRGGLLFRAAGGLAGLLAIRGARGGEQGADGQGGGAVPDARVRVRNERVGRAARQRRGRGGPHEEEGDAGEVGVRAEGAEEGAGEVGVRAEGAGGGGGERGVEDEKVGAEVAQDGAGGGERGGGEGEGIGGGDEGLPGAQAGGVGGHEQDGVIEHENRIRRRA